MQMQDMPLDQVRQNTIVRVSEETVDSDEQDRPPEDDTEESNLTDDQVRSLSGALLLKSLNAQDMQRM
ncbi:hypothetical protein D3C80_2112010 [compost metagenome]